MHTEDNKRRTFFFNSALLSIDEIPKEGGFFMR